jgi:ribosome modulation factor
MKLNKELAEKFCKKLILSDGICNGRNCDICPGQHANNNHKFCTENGWRENFFKDKDEQTVRSAQNWLRINCKPLTNIYEEE